MENNNLYDNYTGFFPEPENMGEEERKLEDKRRLIRIISVALVILCTVFLAVMAGVMIALWDTGKSAHDLTAVLNGSYVYAKTQEELERIAMENEYASAAGEQETDNVEETAEADTSKPQVVNRLSDEEGEDAGNTDEVLADDPGEAEISGIDTVEEAGDDTNAELVNSSDIHVYIDPNVNYPMPFTEVDESYFNDALFIGDSRLQGFGMYSGMPGTFYAATGFQLFKYDSMKVANTENGKVPLTDALPYDTFTKIYIKVGLNEMGGNENAFLNKYAELIAVLRESEPRAIIYVHGLLPVTAAKSQSDKVHNNPNVNARNEALKQFALEQKAYYLDVGSALAGADGSLPSEMAADGIHLKAQYMDIWKQYLLSHAVVVTQ
ncbi:MAG: hypothetical protein IJT80_07150 [Lachnospiraceae bacterium]|nr:hypothetical protein [Lachnospiraceae bacterium]